MADLNEDVKKNNTRGSSLRIRDKDWSKKHSQRQAEIACTKVDRAFKPLFHNNLDKFLMSFHQRHLR